MLALLLDDRPPEVSRIEMHRSIEAALVRPDPADDPEAHEEQLRETWGLDEETVPAEWGVTVHGEA